MENKSNENCKTMKKHKLTKRGKLFLANGIACVVFFIFMYFISAFEAEFLKGMFIFILIQCAFTFFSLIVYYLSIMADALNKRYLESGEKDNQ